MKASLHTTSVNPALSSALLSLEASTQQARPLRWWSLAQQETMRHRFSALLQAWQEDWIALERLSNGHEVQVAVAQEAQASDASAVWRYDDDAKGKGPQRTTSAVLAAATRQLFDFDPLALTATQETPHLTLSVARAALDDWLERVRRMLGATPLVERSDASRPAAGRSGG